MPPLSEAEIAELLAETPQWKVEDGHHLQREFSFPDFVQALAFVNRVGELAESQAITPTST